MRDFDFDFIVIGGGSAGVRAARRAADRGARVALVEAAALGGTCVNAGCIPKKLYSYAAGYAQAFSEAPGFGWRLPGAPRLDWAHLRAQRAREIERLNAVYRDLLQSAGVTIVQAWARLADAHTVQAGGRRLRAPHLLVATGGKPSVPDIPGGEHALVSEQMFDLDPFPRHLLVIGGGYIACEFASIFRLLGARVTLMQRSDHLLGGFDEELRRFLAQQMRESGIDIRFGSEISALRRDARGLLATPSRGPAIRADAALFATGRAPNTQDIGLQEAGVRLDARGAVVVDARYRSSLPSIHAIGDASTRVPLTPVALAEAAAVVDALFPDPREKARQAPPDYALVPTSVFTHPGVAACGHTEAAARERFGALRVFRSEFKPLRHALSGRDERCFMKLVVDAASDRVVGLHMVGADAAEIVQGFAVAMQAGATKADFDRTLGIHPTLAEEFTMMRAPSAH